ncbi:uncharacterized protein LOC120106942 isoform X2 [Phoenix dactylifera]|uniref:Uncharacterized protein LOC120106942 isoform X2 n=1 Tax=Phoenix dactylifera TaxID=42345 RepID=A0A8B8ZXD7_PHODC|nr:uncharacterized protein LOC120106942 isoform X2 [Phoenix dactylifera]
MDGVNGLEKKEMNSKKLKVLCLHGFRTGGSFLRKQIGKWDPSIFQDFLLDFPDGIFLAGGKSDIEDIYPPPYFEWFQFNKGATLSALLISYQAKGKILKDHPPIKFLVSISGCKFRDPKICDIAYKDPIKVKSVHFIGDKDWLRQPSEELTAAFDSPLILRHPQGHTVPRLDEINVKNLSEWTRSILKSSITYDAPGVETWKTEANNANIKQAVVADPKSMEATDSVLKATFTEG